MAYKKGETGNATGRPKLSEEFKQALSDSTMEALTVIREVMANPKARNFDRITAAKYILDKSLGINYQLYEAEDDGDGELVVRIVSGSKEEEKRKK